MNKLNKMLVSAFNKGYRVDKQGNVIGLKGNFLSRDVINSSGYNYFSFRHESKREIVLTHRLQAYQKYGDKLFEERIVVRHKDGNSLNNSWENILIGTQSDNMMDILKEKRKQRSSNPKYDHKSIIEDRNNGMTYESLMNKYNISSKGTLSFIINKSLQKER